MIHYFTFGQTHVCPSSGERLKDYWVEVDMKDFVATERKYAGRADPFVQEINAAEEYMEIWFGKQWSMHYTEKDFNKEWFPKGCYKKIL